MKVCKCGKPANWLKKNKKYLCDDCAQEQGRLIPCTGEAHRNPFIDNCGVCAPRWGWVEVIPPDAATLHLALSALVEALGKTESTFVKDYLTRLPAYEAARELVKK